MPIQLPSTPLVHQCRKIRNSSSAYTRCENGLFMQVYGRRRTSVNPSCHPYKEGVAGLNPASPTYRNRC